METRVIIAGSRDFCDYKELVTRVEETFAGFDENHTGNTIRIISGTARGADRLGEQYAKEQHHKLSRFPADWNRLGRQAGYVRNAEMAKFAVADGNYGVLIAFWDGHSKGTGHMIDLAKRYGLDTYVYIN